MAPVVLVVGAEDDVGRALASNLAASGMQIILAGESSSAADDTLKFIPLDLFGGEKSIESSVRKAWEVHGKLDALVFCCEFTGSLNPVVDISEGEWDATVSRNLKAAWLISRAVANLMRSSSTGGSIIFFTSITSTDRGVFPSLGAYSTCIGGIHHLSKVLAAELGKYNIRVNSIARGFCETDPIVNSQKAPEKSSGLVPLKRWADPTQDFNAILSFLIHSDSSFITGSTITVDGAQSLVRPRLRSRF